MKLSRPVLLAAACLAAGFALPVLRAATDSAAPPVARPLEADDVDRKPEPRAQVAPVYPAELNEKKVSGRAVLSVVVDPRGVVTEASVVSATEPAFGAAAGAAVRQWKFFPALKDEKPVACRIEVTLPFTPDAAAKPPAAASRPAPDKNLANSPLPAGVIRFDQLDKPPAVKVRTAPRYPFEMKRRGIQGNVVVQFIVDEKGFVHDCVALNSTNPEFEGPAIDAVSQWRFKPGVKGGRPVACQMMMPIGFKLGG